ncbi:unnamed protein product [Cylindrotheca closterium]|uniref:sn-1-specific diacylglycerol lipase n=1 Tax=Cylindrotheca closterium TaxID=2856 RepID=A0AAD2JGV8_9STRA|nr:unnamed protein product [Cylindrotheca closterium]
MAWGWGNGDDKEDASKEAGSMIDNAGSLIDVSAKMQVFLDNARNKFEDRYKDVKLRVTLPALIQLVIQAQAKTPSDTEFSRDKMYNTAGDVTEINAKELEGLDRSLNFAEWAYLTSTKELEKNLSSCGYSLLKHEKVDEAGNVGYFIAIDPETKTAVIGIKGTSSLSDMLTDCCAATSRQALDHSFIADDDSFKEISAHEGILFSSNALAKSLKPFVKDLFLPLDYRLCLYGHSLGAGAATLTGLLLRSQYPELIPNHRLEVMAFASPPVLDHKAASACSSFTTTIVNNSDVITRTSLNNVEVLLQILSKIQEKLVEAGMDPVDMQSTAAYLSKIREGKGGEMLMTAEEGFNVLDEAQKNVSVDDPDHLYVPGKVILLYRKWQDRKKRREDLEEMEQVAKGKGESFSEKEAVKDQPPLLVYYVRTDGIADPLRLIEIDDDMMKDHLIGSYHMVVDSLKMTST